MNEIRRAAPGEAIVFRTKDGIIYLGDVVEYDAPDYAEGRDVNAAVSVDAAFVPTAGGYSRDDSQIRDGDDLPDDIPAPDGYNDGVVCIADFDRQPVLLEWAGAFRRDGLFCYRTGAETEIESAEAGAIVRVAMVMTKREEAVTEWGAL